MNDLSAPPVPELNSAWIAARRGHLVDEIAVAPRRHVPRHLAFSGIGALAAVGAATAAIVIAFSGVHASKAFAGWTSAPTRPANGQTATALAQCSSRLADSGGGQSGVPASGWQPTLTDTRGPFTAMILESRSATASCLTGPSFTTTLANATQNGGSQHVMSTRSAGAAPPSSISVLGGQASSGPISQATQEHATLSGGQPYTLLQGEVAAGVSAVTFVLSDGSQVKATVADGSLVAWWPGDAHATSAQATSGSGLTAQQLTFTSISPPNPPPAQTSSP